MASFYALIIAIVAFTIALIALIFAWRAGKLDKEEEIEHVKVKRHHANPVMSPDSGNDWEAAGTFNPAAIKDDDGNTHIIYRAIGSDGVSRVGYAFSKDGLHIDEKLSYPIFALKNPRRNIPDKDKRPDPVMYPSGGSWGGCEDPRAIRIGNRIYMTFNAFDGWDFIRIGVVSITTNDFFARRWNWSRPLYISPEKEIHKNWVVFPEKINGKFAILHSITPEIQVDYVDSLEELDYGSKKIKSKFKQRDNNGNWDNWVRGAGPPPIRTDIGWLVLYHAMDRKDPSIGYKLGAMILDTNDPTKIIARAPAPILVPDEWYENDWKPGVVYACGSTIKDGNLYVYYGGGDKHICVAHTPLDQLLEWLMTYGKIA
ncbi:MAG: hypothetical protein M1459_01370 [Patescibacteria group bacterium]|nr:hypothetical protein [Patescibacteria group bacterium]